MRSGMIEYVADGTHEAHVALMRFDAPARRLPGVGKSVSKALSLRLSGALQRTRTSSICGRRLVILCRGRLGRVFPCRRRRAVPGQLDNHIRGLGSARLDTGPPGKVYGATGEYMLGS